MALTDDVRAVLKTVYKDGVPTLLGRLDPVFKDVEKMVYRGKELRYLNIYGRAPGVAPNKAVAAAIAANSSTKNAEWVVPLDDRQLFGVTVVTQKQMLASKDKAGAYQTIGQNLMYGSMSGLRRQAAALFYSKGFGEFGEAPADGTLVVGNANTIVLPRSAVMAIDLGTQFQFAGATGVPAANASINIVLSIDAAPAGSPAGSMTVKFSASAADAYTAGDYLVYFGNHSGSLASPGNIIAPHGLGAIFPTADRGSVLYGINRSWYPNRLSGVLVDDSALPAATTTKISTINKVVNEVRQAGGDDTNYIVVLSSNDYAEIFAEVNAQERYTQTPSQKERDRIFKFGISDIEFSMATSWIKKSVDTPFLEDGQFYVLSLDTIKVVTYSNWSPIEQNDGPANNEPGTDNPLAEKDMSEETMRVNIDDIFSLQPAPQSPDGNAVEITAALYYDVICLRPAVNGVGLFAAA